MFDSFIFKNDYFPYFDKTNTLGYLAINYCFVAMEASFKLHQIVLKTTASIRKTKHN